MVLDLPPTRTVITSDDPAWQCSRTNTRARCSSASSTRRSRLAPCRTSSDSTAPTERAAAAPKRAVTSPPGSVECRTGALTVPPPRARDARRAARGARIGVTIATPTAKSPPISPTRRPQRLQRHAAVASAVAMGTRSTRSPRTRERAAPSTGRAAARRRSRHRPSAGQNPAAPTRPCGPCKLDPEPLHLRALTTAPDGRDISFIWDFDYEPMLERAARSPDGDRAHELALRVRYSGVPVDAMRVGSGASAALDAALAARRRARPLCACPPTRRSGSAAHPGRRGLVEEFCVSADEPTPSALHTPTTDDLAIWRPTLPSRGRCSTSGGRRACRTGPRRDGHEVWADDASPAMVTSSARPYRAGDDDGSRLHPVCADIARWRSGPVPLVVIAINTLQRHPARRSAGVPARRTLTPASAVS